MVFNKEFQEEALLSFSHQQINTMTKHLFTSHHQGIHSKDFQNILPSEVVDVNQGSSHNLEENYDQIDTIKSSKLPTIASESDLQWILLLKKGELPTILDILDQ